MRSKKNDSTNEKNSYDLSISDLMAALCCIFIIFFAFGINKLNSERKIVEAEKGNLENELKELKRQTGIASEYRLNQKKLYEKIYNTFANELEEWGAEIEPTKGTVLIRFTKDSMMFAKDDSNLTENFKQVLSDFFPRLIQILQSPEYSESIEEIRIEGHTAVDNNLTRKDDYETGMKLSQKRTREVLYYCLNTIPEYRDEVQKNIIAVGYSNSRPAEEVAKTRRVEFNIRTRAENIIDKLKSE